MPGPNTGSNRFGPSSYIVGSPANGLGNGVNFTSIQDAITQAVADGYDATNPTTILVRPGFYASFTMAPGIQVEGVCAGSAFSNTAAVIGNVTIDSTTAGGVTYALKNLNISDPADALIIQGVGPAIFVDIANCSINGDRGLVVGNTSGTLSQIAIRECRIVGTSIAVDLQLHNTVFTEQTTYQGGTVFAMSGDSRLAMFDCSLDATVNYGIEMTGSVNRVNINFSNIDSPQESIIGTNTGEVVQVTHCTFTSSAASGFYIDAVDQYEFYDLAVKGSAVNVNAIAINFIDWTPHAATAANATLPGGVRGTACFDSNIFTVTDGWVTTTAGPPASTFPVDNGGPGVPLAGAISFLGSTSTDFPIPSGIETHVGATTNEIYFEDRRWISSLIVDPDATVGLRGTFTTITAALAAAVPLQTVYVRPGVYTESFALVSLVNVIGLTTPSGAQSGIASQTVVVDGTISSPVGGGSSSIQNLRVTPAAGVPLLSDSAGSIVTATGCTFGSSAVAIQMSDSSVYLHDCYVTGGTNAVLYDNVASSILGVYDCRLDSPDDTVNFTVSGTLIVDNSEIISTAAGNILDNGGATIEIVHSQFTALASSCLNLMFAGGTTDISYSVLDSVINPITFNAVGHVVRSFQNTYLVGAGSEYVIGPGTYEYGSDVINPITAAGIDAATTKVIYGWRPWADVVSAPGTNSDKGVASFDSAQFTATDGFIQISGGNSPPFTDVSGIVSALRNQGYYATAATTFTLDSLALQGDLVIIYGDFGGGIVVTANAGQRIRLGNQLSAVAGTATSSAIGDSLTLRFRAATSVWETVSSMGNWTIV